MSYTIAIVGATGNVGRKCEHIGRTGLSRGQGGAARLRRSQGTEVSFGDRVLKVKALDNYDFAEADIAIMSAGGDISKELAPRIAAKGCIVIDNFSAWRYDLDVPLIVPEVNAEASAAFPKRASSPTPTAPRRSSSLR